MRWRFALLSVGLGTLASSCSPEPDVLIELKRGECLGSCPAYELAIHGDGRVAYGGRSFVLLDGDHSWTIPREDVSKLVELFEQVDCPPGSDLESPIFDVSSQAARLTTKQETKAVENNGFRECQTDLADGGSIYDAIDNISGAASIIEVHEQTLPMLERLRIDFRSQTGADILVRSLARRDVTLAHALIDRGAPVVGGTIQVIMRDADQSVPAIAAAAPLADVDLARLIINAGGLPDREARARFVAMSAASGCPEMTTLALEHAGDLSTLQLPVSLIHHAASARKDTDGSFWRELYARPDYASWVKCFDPPGVFRLLLAAGADATATAPDGSTGLHHVGDAVSTKLLIDAGANPNAGTSRGRTPLHETDDAEIARVLIRAGADVDARDSEANTPLFDRYSADIVRVLLEAGADPRVRNEFGWTALFDVRDSEAATLLLEAGIDVNARDLNGRTALDYSKDIETAMTLLQAGGRVSTQSELDKQIDWAIGNEREDLAKAFRESKPLAPPR